MREARARQVGDRGSGAPIRLRKSLGQHLLRRPGAARRIVEALDPVPGESVLEIGPGLGALTRVLLEQGLRVVAVERDPRLADELERRLGAGGSLEVCRGDILEVRLEDVCHRVGARRLKVIGNIPYRITSPILHWLLDQASHLVVAVLTVQQEVGERVLARPGGSNYGSLTLAVERKAEAQKILTLPPQAFRPAPRVASMVLRLVPRRAPAVRVPDEDFLERLIRLGFSQRRKMLRTSLLSRVPWSARELGAAAAAAEVSLTRRPQELSLEEFGRLSSALWTVCAREPGEAPGEAPAAARARRGER